MAGISEVGNVGFTPSLVAYDQQHDQDPIIDGQLAECPHPIMPDDGHPGAGRDPG